MALEGMNPCLGNTIVELTFFMYVAKIIILAWLEIVGKLFFYFLKVHGTFGILPNRHEFGVSWTSHMSCFWSN